MTPRGPAIVVAILVLSVAALSASSDPLTERCRELSRKHVDWAKTKLQLDYTLIQTDAFYSKKLDACIHTEVATVGVEVWIRDLSHSIMRDGGHHDVLLYCDPDGADSVRLDKLNQHGGHVFNLPYDEWLDDGFGGPPRALKAPHERAVPQSPNAARSCLRFGLSDAGGVAAGIAVGDAPESPRGPPLTAPLIAPAAHADHATRAALIALDHHATLDDLIASDVRGPDRAVHHAVLDDHRAALDDDAHAAPLSDVAEYITLVKHENGVDLTS